MNPNCTWGRMAQAVSQISGDEPDFVAEQGTQALSVVLHHKNARSILSRSPGVTPTMCSELAAAREVLDEGVSDMDTS